MVVAWDLVGCWGLGQGLGPWSWLEAVPVARVSVRVLAHVRGSFCTSFIHRPLQT